MLKVQIHSTANSSPLSNSNIIHRPTCRLYQPTGSLSVPTYPSTPSSINPYLIDAPAASPEVSDVIDSINSANELQTISPTKFKNRLLKSGDVTNIICAEVNASPSANNMVENILIETMERKPNIHFCECHRQDDISEEEHDDDDDNYEEKKKKKKKSKISLLFDQYCLSYVTKFRQLISRFVGSKYFRRIVLSAIVINTLSMGIEYHGQPDELTNALEYSNLVFTSLFAIEMILKITADGCLKYIKNAYNLFDGGIVIMSVIELQGNKNSGLSVLRTFRLLRVLKLVRFMPTLRRQLVRNDYIVVIH